VAPVTSSSQAETQKQETFPKIFKEVKDDQLPYALSKFLLSGPQTYFLSSVQRWNSSTCDFIEVSEHNLEISQT
jgi:hypothetical protein